MSDVSCKEIVQRLGQISLMNRIAVMKNMKKTGLYCGQHPILSYIIKNEGCTQKELANYIGVSCASIAVSIKRMEKSGLVERRNDENDTRCKRLNATERGRELFEKSQVFFESLDSNMFAGFSQSECNQLSEYLDRIIVNLTGEKFKSENIISLIKTEKEIFSEDNKEEDDD
ncbi:MAG: MarR family winged helix-turn-helix transcriptional regulator [Clostridiales bacterium]|nr:MarR family winged helix-turn-helix transcriptional regulator [Clostridiales bacterium]